MKKIILAFVSSLLFVACNQAPKTTAEMKEDILRQANEMTRAFLNKEKDAYMDKVYPGFVDMMGGRKAMSEIVDRGYVQLKSQFITIDSMKFLPPNPIVNTGTQLQTTLTEVVVLRKTTGRMVTKTTIIAISQDDGITWTFLDTSGKSLIEMQKEFPNLSDKLFFPKKEEPIIYN